VLEHVTSSGGASYDSTKVASIFAATAYKQPAAPSCSPDFVADANRTVAGQMSNVGLRMEMLRSRSERQKQSGDISEELAVLKELANSTQQAVAEIKTLDVFRRFVREAHDICEQLLAETERK
jgi:hypothetical protein